MVVEKVHARAADDADDIDGVHASSVPSRRRRWNITMVISATGRIDDIRDRVVVVVVDARACIG